MKGFFKSDRILTTLTHIMYGIPPKWAMMENGRPHWYAMTVSAFLLLLQWCAFGFDMHCVKTYWRGKLQPKIPLETLLLLISLNLSGACSFTLLVLYFYHKHNNFEGPITKLVPYIPFSPDGEQRDVGPTSNDWSYVNTFLIFGVAGVVLVMYCAFGLNVFFDFEGLHNFTVHISGYEKIIYYSTVGIIYWGFASAIIASCIFYIVCRDVVRHIEFTENLIISTARNFVMARELHERLLQYTEKVTNSVKLWFVIHNLFFIFITLSTVVEWIILFTHLDGRHMFRLLLAQTAGSLLIAFKYAFPFVAASRVTTKFDKMYHRINTQCKPNIFPELDTFMRYCMRCKAGFTVHVFGIKVTAKIALISLLSCFLGFFKLYLAIK